ncbi:hypothetical protein SLEP1_g26765 [Rubroshorea leprosula]|uniref:Late embryogenesis abundant protein LEA-2 subgroup domain-containing protein n=1 Tax=Rubroshorea leprosula TaxID=152421 RepID=A0AAV5K0M3_9ROSI|nr:hypothetical protein SLEP1_g26765 [Rubroshorea leprosula]
MGKRLKICCAVSAIFLIIILVTLLVLFFTVFKSKEPIISPLPATLTYLEPELPPPEITLNVSLAITATVDNRNYGVFKYENSTAYINYHKEVIAAAPILEGRISARSKQNITTTVDVLLATVNELSNPVNIWIDYNNGVFNLTSSTTMHGKVSPLNMIKIYKSHQSLHM